MRPCLDCGTLSEGSRCPEHQSEQERLRGSATARGYDYRWQRLMAEVKEEHVRLHGWTCPGWQRPPHPAADLTGDHRVPLSAGGKSVRENVIILCRSCNSAKGGAPGGRVADGCLINNRTDRKSVV